MKSPRSYLLSDLLMKTLPTISSAYDSASALLVVQKITRFVLRPTTDQNTVPILLKALTMNGITTLSSVAVLWRFDFPLYVISISMSSSTNWLILCNPEILIRRLSNSSAGMVFPVWKSIGMRMAFTFVYCDVFRGLIPFVTAQTVALAG